MPSLLALLSLLAGAAKTVDAPAGPVLGSIDRGVAVFRGIPYARPPVGNLRWRAPQPLARWSTRLQALRFGAVCMQTDPKGDAGVGVEVPSEDCLTLNLWAPASARNDLGSRWRLY